MRSIVQELIINSLYSLSNRVAAAAGAMYR